MPRPPNVPRPHTDVRPRWLHSTPRRAAITLLYLLALISAFLLPAAPVSAAPLLTLPTPPGEAWKIIQGYGCGSHNSWDRYSLDLVNTDGRTFGAPVRAAAEGAIWSWTAKSDTLILAHGIGFYTMYTHLDRTVSTKLERTVQRGEVIGYAGERAANGLPHLHFTAFTGKGIAASGRQSVPLSFAEGYDLPETGGCNQHGGELLKAGGEPAARVTSVQFTTEAQPERWYNGDVRIEFQLPDDARGFSQAWDQAPAGDAPQFATAREGYVQASWAGEGLHTLQLRYWDAAGAVQTASFGPVGYDTTPPSLPAALGTLELAAGQPATIGWGAAADNGAGVAGYRVYVGADPNGTADTLVAAPAASTPALAPGAYLLRVQVLDYAGNASSWATIARLAVAE